MQVLTKSHCSSRLYFLCNHVTNVTSCVFFLRKSCSALHCTVNSSLCVCVLMQFLSTRLKKSTLKIRFRVLTSGGLIFNGLLEDSDVFKSAEEQDHLIVLIPDGGHLHVEPHRGSWQHRMNTTREERGRDERKVVREKKRIEGLKEVMTRRIKDMDENDENGEGKWQRG